MTKLYSFLGVLLFVAAFGISQNATAKSSGFAYMVSSKEKTLIQIARDVYNDERLWKRISYWNNITPPYNLSVGQVLVLPQAPTLPLAPENSVSVENVPAPVFVKHLPSVEQQLSKTAGSFTYVVNERAPSLSMVALETYGNKKMAAVIAKWNGLAPKSKLALQQTLKLKLQPRYDKAHAHQTLVTEWIKLGNPEMVARLKNKNYLNLTANIKLNTKLNSSVPQQINPTTENLPQAPVVIDPDSKREPAALQTERAKAELPADQNAESSWYGERSANAIESLFRSISN